jgi:hypothetical protein
MVTLDAIPINSTLALVELLGSLFFSRTISSLTPTACSCQWIAAPVSVPITRFSRSRMPRAHAAINSRHSLLTNLRVRWLVLAIQLRNAVALLRSVYTNRVQVRF